MKLFRACQMFCFLSMFLAEVYAIDLSPQGLSIEGTEVIFSNGKYQLLEYHAKTPPLVKLEKGVQVVKCRWQNSPCSPPPWSLRLLELPQSEKDTRLELTYVRGKKKHEVVFQVLSEKFPFIKVTGVSRLSLPFIFAASTVSMTSEAHCSLVVLDHKHQLQFTRLLPKACGDFRPHHTAQGVRYSYQEVEKGVGMVGFFGPRVILDENFKLLTRLNYSFDGHEFHLLGDNHWIGLEFVLGRLSSGMGYFDKKFRERKNDGVVFEWGVSDFLKQTQTELATHAMIGDLDGEPVIDLLHLNALQLVDENRWLISFGYNGLGLLNKRSKKLDWIFGGASDEFQLTARTTPVFLHTPIFDAATETLWIFSNRTVGSIRTTFSRVLQYKLSTAEKKVKEFKVLRDRREFSYQMGAIQVYGPILSVSLGTREIGEVDYAEMEGQEDLLTWKFQKRDHIVYRIYRSPYGEFGGSRNTTTN